MPIVGFGFEKINIEKKQQFGSEDEIKNRILITTIEETTIKKGSEEEPGMLAKFEFGLDYGKAGALEFKGFVIYTDSKEMIRELINIWGKDKKLPAKLSTQLFNFVLTKSNLQALQLESEVGLPFHLKMPRFKIEIQNKE